MKGNNVPIVTFNSFNYGGGGSGDDDDLCGIYVEIHLALWRVYKACCLLKLFDTHYLILFPIEIMREKKLQQEKPWYSYHFCGF